MMYELKVREEKRVIEMTSRFAKEASNYGSPEYNQLQEARRDYPNFKVITKKSSKKTDGFKGLTFDYMEKYIKGKIESSREEKETEELSNTLISFYALCGKDKNGKKLEFAATATYGEVKSWFLDQFKEFNAYRSNINKILGKAA